MSTDPMQTSDHMSEIQPEGTLVQSPDEQARAAAASGASGVSIPGYEIECELGRGGMGVVYKAKQTGLNRTVALKMVIAGPYADPATRARFLLEAESVAAMEHPNVVKVFAFGEHDGHPFLAMEFLPGGSLAGYAKARGPLPANEATTLVAKVAASVAHAHSRGVVHRDIKPANILLTPDGEPRLTDFGLAKVGRSDLSVTGQVLGTPAYMAPEQAAGKVHEVGTAADVYALGAVLYDLLTGQPPFRGDSVAVTLQKVMTTEPDRPRKLNPTIPHDLETVCLKCMEKEPGKRYATAQAVADDLNRFLAGEPISARATGSFERAVKWVKRNKGLAAAVSGVTLALLIGTTVSIAFGVEAKKQAKAASDAAERERGEAKRADKERDDAIDARNDLKTSNDTLERINDDLNGALAKAFLAPVLADRSHLRLTLYEVEALWGLATRRKTSVNPRFLEEATRSPWAFKQLANRGEYSLHATIGLDPDLRNKAEQLLAARLGESGITLDQQVDLALACVHLSGLSPPLAARVKALLLTILNKPINTADERELAAGLAMLTERMPLEAAAETLTTALHKTRDFDAQHKLARRLEIVTERMPLETAVKTLSDAIQAKDSKARRNLGKGLVRVTERMAPEAAAKTLTETMDRITDHDALGVLTWGLVVTTGRLAPEAAVRILTERMDKTEASNALRELAGGLAVAGARVPPEAAASVCSAAAKTLTNAMDKTTEISNLGSLAEALAVLSERMPPESAARTCSAAAKTLTDAIAKTTGPSDLSYLANGLKLVAGRMPPEAAASVCSAAAKTLTEAMDKTTDFQALRSLAWGLAKVAGRLAPEDAAWSLMGAMSSGRYGQPILAEALRTVAFGFHHLGRERAVVLTMGCVGTCGLFSGLPLLHPDIHPQPKPLPPQTLIELLKHPFCVGEARRAVLDALEFTYNRKFADQWEFVQFVRDNKLPLDLLTPPKRLQPNQ